MAVTPSPFMRQPLSGNKPKEEETNAQRKAREFLELNKSVDTAIKRVRETPNERLSPKDKQLLIAEIEKLGATGKSTGEVPSGNIFRKALGGAKDVVSNVFAPFAPRNNQVSDVIAQTWRAVNRVGQSALKEGIADVRVSQGQKPWQLQEALLPLVGGAAPVARLLQMGAEQVGLYDKKLDPKLKAELEKQGKAMGDTYKPSLRDFVSQIADPEWKYKNSATAAALRVTNPIVGFASELGVEIVADPTTYVTGIGNVKYVGRAGKLALAERLMTAEKVAQYPQLAGRGNDIVRFGQNAPIEGFREILKAEGIESGIRVLGQVVKGTERISTPVGRTVSGVWEKAMDYATAVRNSGWFNMSPSSRSWMQDVGRFAKGGGYRLDEADALKNIATWSARQYAKGQTPYQANRFVSQIRETVKEAKEAGLGDDLSDLVERANPNTYAGKAVFDTLDETRQRLVQQYVDWQDNVYKETEAVYKKFGVDFGTDVPDFTWINNYIFHKVTPEAAKWIAEESGKKFSRYSKYVGAEHLDAADITDMSSPLRYRKYRAPEVLPDGTVKYETFMGEEVKQGTIKELNEIFKRQTGTDIKFFETDAGLIAESYAYSMAKMRGREAFVRRLMDYGDVGAAKLLDKTIPDPALRSAAAKELEEITTIRNGLRQSLGRNMTSLREVVRRSVQDAEDLVKGNFRSRGANKRATDAVIARISQLETNLVKLREQAETLGAAARGEFDVVHSAMLTNIQNLKRSLENGTAELDEIRLGLQTTYQTMYPNATKIPDDIEVLADRIAAGRGIPAAREARAINEQLKVLRAQLDELTPNTEEYAQLADEVKRLKDLDNGFRVMAEYRMAQDYAPDNGFLFVAGRDLAETDGMQIPFKLGRTTANGMPDPNDVVAIRVFGNEEVLDFRTAGGVARTFGINDFGDGLVDQLRAAGIDATPLEDALDAVRVGLPLDPELEQAYPDIADLVRLMQGNQAREILPYGDPQLIKAIYEEFVDATTGLLMRVGVDNADYVSRSVVDGALGFVADVGMNTGTARGVLLPAVLFDEAAELDDIVVLMSPRFTAKATDSVTGSVQDASSPLIQAIMRTDAESAANASRAKLNELTARKSEIDDTTTALKQQITTLSRRKGGLKSAATRRKNAAAAAKERAGQVRNAPREILIDGKPTIMTPTQINKRFEVLTASEKRLRANMERTLVAEQAALREGGLTLRGTEARLASNTDRLRVLMDEALALHAWDTGTGMMVRDEIAAGIDIIASMPPAGTAGEATRNWLASVQRGMDAATSIKDPATRTAYERLHQLSAYDEWNLSLADEAVTTAKGLLEDIEAGRIGAILDSVDKRLLDGWEAIDGLGVQVPTEVLNVWRPNLLKILSKQNRGAVASAWVYLNKVFKTYAIGTPGFIVRNLYSALFMNGVAGVDAKTMSDGYKAMHYYRKYGADKWLDKLGIMDAAERQIYEQAVQATEAAGRRGLLSDLSEPMVKGTRRAKVANAIVNNPYTNMLRGANTRVEDAVRFPLALKAMRDGSDYVGAATQINRYHFDYTDLSAFDEKMLQVIPFWIWATRNLPNQLANQWMRPQLYGLWENLQESLPADDNVLMPSWMKGYEPMSLARFGMPNVVLRPDMPHQGLGRTFESFTSGKIVGQMYPVPKLVIEGLAGKNIALDTPFRSTPREAKGIDTLTASLLNAAGFEGAAPKVRDEFGKEQQMITDFPSYAVGNMVPLIATLQRITGGRLGGKASYSDRQASAIASFLGVPVDFVTDRMQGSEAINRQFNVADYATRLQELGMIESKDAVRERTKAAREANEQAMAASKAALINEVSLQLLKAKEKYGTGSAEYKELKKKLSDLKSPKRYQTRIDEENIIALYGKDSLQHRRWLEEQKLETGD